MENKLAELNGRVQQLIDRIGAVSLEAEASALPALQRDLQEISMKLPKASRMEEMEGDGLKGERSDRMAACRHALHQASERMEQLQTMAAEQYREILGDDKALFEKYSSVLQQQSNPQAYRCLQAFQELGACRRDANAINGELLDIEGELEHAALQRKGMPVGEAADQNRDGGETTRPSLSP